MQKPKSLICIFPTVYQPKRPAFILGFASGPFSGTSPSLLEGKLLEDKICFPFTYPKYPR